MEYQPSPRSIPLPLSNPLSPALPAAEVYERRQTAIDLFPSNVRDLQDLGQLDLERLRRAMDDDGASSVAGRSVGDEDETEFEDKPPQTQEVPIASSTVPTGDSLFQALRSPSPEPVQLASSSNTALHQQVQPKPAEGVTESSGELTRLMARYPMIIGGPASAPHKMVRAMSHESFIDNLRRASPDVNGDGPRGCEYHPSQTSRTVSAQTGLPSSGSKYSEDDISAQNHNRRDVAIQVSPSLTSATTDSSTTRASPQEHPEPAHATQAPVHATVRNSLSSGYAHEQLQANLSGSATASPVRSDNLSTSLAPVPSSSCTSRSLYDEVKAAESRNDREREALEREMARARQEADELERQCDELTGMLRSLGLQPPALAANEIPASPSHSIRSPERPRRSPQVDRHAVRSPAKNEYAPQTRTVSYHHMNGHQRRQPDQEDRRESDSAARHALERTAAKLSLPISALTGTTSQTPRSPNPYEPQSLDDVVRAMDFLRSADALIWKGRRETGRISGRAGDSVFAEENVRALRERLGVWERVVRSKR